MLCTEASRYLLKLRRQGRVDCPDTLAGAMAMGGSFPIAIQSQPTIRWNGFPPTLWFLHVIRHAQQFDGMAFCRPLSFCVCTGTPINLMEPLSANPFVSACDQARRTLSWNGFPPMAFRCLEKKTHVSCQLLVNH